MSYEELWQSSTPNLAPVDIEVVVRKSRELERRVAFRNFTEWAAVLIAVPSMIVLAIAPVPLITRISAGYLAVVSMFVGWVLVRYGRLRPLPDPAQSTQAYLEALHTRFTSQAKLLSAVPTWYVAPMAVGIAGVYVGLALAAPAPLSAFLSRFWMHLLGTGAFLLFVCFINVRGAQQLRQRAEALREND